MFAKESDCGQEAEQYCVRVRVRVCNSLYCNVLLCYFPGCSQLSAVGTVPAWPGDRYLETAASLWCLLTICLWLFQMPLVKRFGLGHRAMWMNVLERIPD